MGCPEIRERIQPEVSPCSRPGENEGKVGVPQEGIRENSEPVEYYSIKQA
jgi:hypothetical protein